MEQGPEDIEKSQPGSGDEQAPLLRDDRILLERLKVEPPLKKQAPLSLTIGVIAVVLALGAILYFAFRKPDVYFDETPQLGQQTHPHDTTELHAKRMHVAPIIDSLEQVVKADHENAPALLALANSYYDAEYWDRALMTYEHYLEHEPKNVNARIDYAYTIAQVSGDFKLAIAEIDTALTYQPDHLQGLFNAGLLSLRANIDDKEAALSSARKYFDRAKSAATKQGNSAMSSQIDEILKEMDKVTETPTATP